MHRRWIGIRASAVLEIAGSLATLLVGGVTLFGTLAAPPPKGVAAPPFPLAAIGIAMAAIAAGLSGWGIWTAVGIFRRREWARISILVFAALLTLTCAGGSLAILFMQFPIAADLSPRAMDAVRWGVAGFYGVLTAIGAWWLVLFNLRSTKEYFAQGGPIAPRTRPLSVSIIAWYLLIGGLAMPVAAVIRMPAFVFGAVITGWGGQAVYAIFAAVQILLGAGLLRLREPARVGAIGYFCFTALNSVLTFTPPGLAAKMQIVQREMPWRLPAGASAQMPQPGWVFVLLGIAFAAVPVWFLARRREAFVKVADAQ